MAKKKYLQETDCLDFAERKTFFLVLDTADYAISYTDKYLVSSNYIGMSEDEHIHFFHPKNSDDKPFNSYLKKYRQHPDWLYEQYDKSKKAVELLHQAVELWQGDNSSITLRNLFDQYLQARVQALRGVNVLRKLDSALQEFLMSECSYLSADDLIILSYPQSGSVINQERQAVLKVAIRIKKHLTKKKLPPQLGKIYSNFAASTMGWHTEAPRPLDYYIKEVNKLARKNPVKLLAKLQAANKRYLALRSSRQKKIKKKHSALIKILPALPYLKDGYRLSANQANFYFQLVFSTLSKKYKVDVNDIWRMSIREIRTMIKNGQVPRKKIVKRKKIFAYYSYHNKNHIFYGQAAKKFMKYFYNVSHKPQSGRVASPGRGQGQVCVVRSQKDFNKFKQGNILVVNNTTPDYIPIMNKASAIIAEEGGITAHVSIVSRELKIPCIIGVYRATKLFKNGQYISVDAINCKISILNSVN